VSILKDVAKGKNWKKSKGKEIEINYDVEKRETGNPKKVLVLTIVTLLLYDCTDAGKQLTNELEWP